jgi:hypothetical protein
MDIKEVLNLPTGTEVKANSVCYMVVSENGVKVLSRGGYWVKLTQPLVTTEYELVRKKLNFFEAMRLVDEGKVVESCDDFKYKKVNNNLAVLDEWDGQTKVYGLDVDEITGDWYEVTE